MKSSLVIDGATAGLAGAVGAAHGPEVDNNTNDAAPEVGSNDRSPSSFVRPSTQRGTALTSDQVAAIFRRRMTTLVREAQAGRNARPHTGPETR
jgi:hypothetical protein